MKFKEFKQKVKAIYVEGKTRLHVWYVQNEVEIWTKATIALPVVATITGYAYKAIKANADEHHRLMEKYDPATGYYCQLKRPLTSKDMERMLSMQRELGLTQTECLIRLNLVK